MVDQNSAYFFKKRGVYYFSKRIPSDLKHLYQVERLTRSLRTKCERKAKSQVQAMLLKLDDHWSKSRLHSDILHNKSLNQNKVNCCILVTSDAFVRSLTVYHPHQIFNSKVQ